VSTVRTAKLRGVACGLLLLAGCSTGSSHDASAPPPANASSSSTAASSPAPTTAPASSTSVAAPGPSPRCTTAELAISAGRTGAGLGHVGTPIVFQNTSRTACHLSGYPGVAALDDAGNQVVQAMRTLQGYLGGLRAGDRPPVVELAPGETASALVEGTNVPPGTATTCPNYPSLLVTPPDDTRSVMVRVVVSGCSAIQIHPVVPGMTGTVPA